MEEGIINYEDFEKIEMRVAEIENVEDIEGADKLYKLTLNVGELDQRIVCAGIKQYYSREDLKGKRVVLLVNLAPRKLRGIKSQGMVLAASNKEHSEVVLLTPDADIEIGSRIS